MGAPIDLGRTNPHCSARFHGTRNAYRAAKCRCPEAIAVHSNDARTYNAGKPSRTGIIRRVRALMIIGRPPNWIAARTGIPAEVILAIAGGDHTAVTAPAIKAIPSLYDACHTDDGPEPCTSERGWYGPDAWDETTIDNAHAKPFSYRFVDELAIEYAVAGDRHIAARLTTAERSEVIRRLTIAGKPSADIAELVGLAQRNIVKHRARSGVSNHYSGVAA